MPGCAAWSKRRSIRRCCVRAAGGFLFGRNDMATLVLTVVGGIVGGPVGAAIGAAVGQQVDAAIFKPRGREGPRLAALEVQASTYGLSLLHL